ncbi:MAG TPA: alpha/beta hydrolase [Thermoleophilaceae bacterium]|nr:alpha/beta hydrolase [Thermoleophilaceae bacterium]
MTHSTNTIQLSTGVTLPYVEQGDPSGIPMILLHGYSDSLRSYDLMLPHLPDAIHAYALTQRGHGDADKPARGYRPEDYAADVAAFLDAAGIEAALIVGHSGGSYAAQRFAVDYPDRTLGVVLIGTFHSFDGNPAVDELQEAVVHLTDPVDRAFAREFQESCVARPVPAAFLEAIIDGSARMPARVWKAWLEDTLAADAPTQTGSISAPTLIMWGDQDAFCPRSDQDALLAAIRRSRLSTYEGTGHCPHWEQPARSAAEIAAFAAAAASQRDELADVI